MPSFVQCGWQLVVLKYVVADVVSQDAEVEGALDATCRLCRWPMGAFCLLTGSDIAVQIAMRALGRGMSGGRIQALHALAMVAGAGFAGTASNMAREELLLDPRAESALQVRVLMRGRGYVCQAGC